MRDVGDGHLVSGAWARGSDSRVGLVGWARGLACGVEPGFRGAECGVGPGVRGEVSTLRGFNIDGIKIILSLVCGAQFPCVL